MSFPSLKDQQPPLIQKYDQQHYSSVVLEQFIVLKG